MSTQQSSEKSVAERVVELLGGPARIVADFNISLQAAHKWRRQIPAKRVREVVTRIKGVYSAQQIRPDIFGESAERAA